MNDSISLEMYNFFFQLESCLVYCVHIEDRSVAGSFIVPPSPGILAFLQRLHLIDFKHQVKHHYFFIVFLANKIMHAMLALTELKTVVKLLPRSQD